MGDMEAEMARFEEEIATGGDGPPMLPPPPFLPHSLQSSKPDADKLKGKDGTNSANSQGNSFSSSGQTGTSGPGFSGPNGPRPGGPMGPGDPGPMRFPGPMGPGPNFSGPNFSGPMGDGGMIGPRPPPMPGFFPPPVLPDFSDFMSSGDSKPSQSVYSSGPVLSKKVIEVPVKPKELETTDSDIGPAGVGKQAPVQPKPETFAFGPPGLMYGGPQAMYNQSKPSSSNSDKNQGSKKKKYIRTAAGNKWEDPTLLDWDPNDYRIFCGDLGNEVTDDTLARVFNKYPSFQKARVVREKNNKKSRGYGFVSFKDPSDFIRAMREMNGKYVGNRPIKLRKSTWKDRNIDVVRKKVKEKKKLGYKI